MTEKNILRYCVCVGGGGGGGGLKTKRGSVEILFVGNCVQF